jgi:hypothetical protein
MKPIRLFIVLGFLTIVHFLSAQNELSTVLEQLQQTISNVSAEKATYTQKWSYDPDRPYSIQFFLEEVDSKGRADTETYFFNLSDINDNSLRYRTQRDLILVEVKTSANQKFLKKMEDGEFRAYESSFMLVASDVDNARAMIDLMKEAIPLAIELMKDRLNVGTFDQKISWIQSNLSEFEIGGTTYKYEWKQGQKLPTRFTLEVDTDDGKRQSVEAFSFNLGDFDAKSVKMQIRGNIPVVSFETEKRKRYIRYTKEGELQNFESSIEVGVDEVDLARDLSTVLSALIEEANQKLPEQLLTFEGLVAAQDFLMEKQWKTTIGEDTYSQTFKGDCFTTLTVDESSAKGENKVQEYTFEFAHINPDDLDIEVSGQSIYLKLQVNDRQRWIGHTENGEQQNYENSVEFIAPDIETARQLQKAFEATIAGCSDLLKESTESFVPEQAAAWLAGQTKNVKTRNYDVQQELELDAEDPCKATFTLTQSTDKRSEQSVFEFNWMDLDKEKTEINVSGTEVYLEFTTKNREKIIKLTEDGEVAPYEESFRIYFEEIRIGLLAEIVGKLAIGHCQE